MKRDELLVSTDMSNAAYYGKVFIGGEWQEATGGRRRDVVNPANAKVIGTVAAGTIADVDRAAQAAKTAFDSGVWSGR
jgi:acyl-CoA reductase-like NAD-dependent aldehyde dehydrogenase